MVCTELSLMTSVWSVVCSFITDGFSVIKSQYCFITDCFSVINGTHCVIPDDIKRIHNIITKLLCITCGMYILL